MEQHKAIWRPPVFWQLLKHSFSRLKRNDPLRMAGATAFFTSFALPPIIVLLFQLFSIFFPKKLIGTELGEVLSTTLGTAGAQQLRSTARGLRHLAQNWYMAVLGLLFLIFVATTLFKVIKNTFNDLWNIRVDQSSFMYDLKTRGISLAIILAAALLFLAAEIIDTIQSVAGKYLGSIWKEGSLLTSALNEIAGVVVIIAWFIVLFRFLGNGRPSWRVALAGGIITGILFYLGKILLSMLMSHSNADIVYGAGAAIVLILLFMFYSSFILYFGACFIKEYSLLTDDPIIPLHEAYLYELQKIDDKPV